MIVITTPTGTIGRQVVQQLVAQGAAVRVIVRDPSRLPPAIRDRVEVVTGSHGDLDVVTSAFTGADAVFWLAPPWLQAPTVEAVYQDFTRAVCPAFKLVERVVGVSALGRGVLPDAGLVTASLAMDDLITQTGVHYRALTLPSFMDNVLTQLGALRAQGTFYSVISGDRRLPTCATQDIAAVATRLLLDETWTGQSEVPVLGPEDLSHNEMAGIMSDVLGRPIHFQQITAEAFLATLTGNGMPPAMARGMLDMMLAKNNGLDNAVPRTPASTTPTTFRQWCEQTLKPAFEA